jgi:malic enzyme
MLQVAQVTVLKEVDGHDGPLVEISLYAPFEPEHDLGILTDGEKILGIGYMSDVRLFE